HAHEIERQITIRYEQLITCATWGQTIENASCVYSVEELAMTFTASQAVASCRRMAGSDVLPDAIATASDACRLRNRRHEDCDRQRWCCAVYCWTPRTRICQNSCGSVSSLITDADQSSLLRPNVEAREHARLPCGPTVGSRMVRDEGDL